MKYIPILFSTPMVQAEKACRKTKTRRTRGLEEINQCADDFDFVSCFNGLAVFCENKNWENLKSIKCPYGRPGDVLWVRECFANLNSDFKDNVPFYIYKADPEPKNGYGVVTWRPSIHMPKAACRTFLQVVTVRVERLQDISEQDAIAEGVESCIADLEKFGCRAQGMRLFRNYDRKDNSLKDYPCNGFDSAKFSFETLWQSINGKDSWDANPWVWVVEFKRIEKPTDFIK